MLGASPSPLLPPTTPLLAPSALSSAPPVPQYWSVFYPAGLETQPPPRAHYLHLGCWCTVTSDYYQHRRTRAGERAGHGVLWLHTARPRDRFVFLVEPVEGKRPPSLWGWFWSQLYGTPPAFAWSRGKLLWNIAGRDSGSASQDSSLRRGGVECVEILHSDITAMDYTPAITTNRLSLETKVVTTRWFASREVACAHYKCSIPTPASSTSGAGNISSAFATSGGPAQNLPSALARTTPPSHVPIDLRGGGAGAVGGATTSRPSSAPPSEPGSSNSSPHSRQHPAATTTAAAAVAGTSLTASFVAAVAAQVEGRVTWASSSTRQTATGTPPPVALLPPSVVQQPASPLTLSSTRGGGGRVSTEDRCEARCDQRVSPSPTGGTPPGGGGVSTAAAVLAGKPTNGSLGADGAEPTLMGSFGAPAAASSFGMGMEGRSESAEVAGAIAGSEAPIRDHGVALPTPVARAASGKVAAGDAASAATASATATPVATPRGARRISSFSSVAVMFAAVTQATTTRLVGLLPAGAGGGKNSDAAATAPTTRPVQPPDNGIDALVALAALTSERSATPSGPASLASSTSTFPLVAAVAGSSALGRAAPASTTPVPTTVVSAIPVANVCSPEFVEMRHTNTMVIVYAQDPHFNAVVREVLMPDDEKSMSLTVSVAEQRRLLSLFEAGMPAWTIFLSRWGLPYRRWFRLVYVLLYNLWPVIALTVGLYDLYKHMPFVKDFLSESFHPFTSWLEEHFTFKVSILATYLFTVSFNVLAAAHSFFKSIFSVLSFLKTPLSPLVTVVFLLRYPLQLVWLVLGTVLLPLFSTLSATWSSAVLIVATPVRAVAALLRFMSVQSAGRAVSSTVSTASSLVLWWRSWMELWDKVLRPVKNVAKAFIDGVYHVGVAIARREASLRRWYFRVFRAIFRALASIFPRIGAFLRAVVDIVNTNADLWSVPPVILWSVCLAVVFGITFLVGLWPALGPLLNDVVGTGSSQVVAEPPPATTAAAAGASIIDEGLCGLGWC